MTTEKELIHQLQTLRNTPEVGTPSASEKERVFKVLQTVILSEAKNPVPISTGSLVATLLGMTRGMGYFIPPQFAYVAAVFALLVSATAAGYMSRQALPGTSLYSTKIALEYTQARLVSNPSERAKVQMDMAGRRLQELRAITEQTGEPNGRVEKTLKQFTKEVKSAKNTLKQAGDPLQAEEAAQDLAKKARQYEEELLKAKAGVKPGREVGVAALEEALQELSTSQ